MNPKIMNLTRMIPILCAFWIALTPLAAQTQRIDVSPGDTLFIKLKTGGTVYVEVGDQHVVEVSVDGAESCPGCDLRIEAVSAGVRISSDYSRRRNHSSSLSFNVRLMFVYLKTSISSSIPWVGGSKSPGWMD